MYLSTTTLASGACFRATEHSSFGQHLKGLITVRNTGDRYHEREEKIVHP